jgi:hypothetical protein
MFYSELLTLSSEMLKPDKLTANKILQSHINKNPDINAGIFYARLNGLTIGLVEYKRIHAPARVIFSFTSTICHFF